MTAAARNRQTQALASQIPGKTPYTEAMRAEYLNRALVFSGMARCGDCDYYEHPVCKVDGPRVRVVQGQPVTFWPEPPKGKEDWCGKFSDG